MLAAIDSHLSEDAASACEAGGTITLDELTRFLATFPRGKRPGSDGLPYEFLQQFWHDLGPILLPVFLEAFREEGSLTPSEAHGLVTLLYKGSGPSLLPANHPPQLGRQTPGEDVDGPVGRSPHLGGGLDANRLLPR